MAESKSYWTKRRHIKKRVLQHKEHISRQSEFLNKKFHPYLNSTSSNSTSESKTVQTFTEENNILPSLSDDPSTLPNQTYGCNSTDDYEYSPTLVQADCSNTYHANGSVPDSDARSVTSESDDCDLSHKLANWVTEFKITHKATSGLLEILQNYFPNLPKDPRTLLNTPRSYNVKHIAGGSYHHFGLEQSLIFVLSCDTAKLQSTEEVSIQINIDGLPLFKSSRTQFWPILGRLTIPLETKPFIIGLYCGDQKPGNINEFLHDFVSEVKLLNEQGLLMERCNRKLKVKISCFICDAPARAFVKQVKYYNAYHGCEKCTQRGIWIGKVTYPSISSPLRTDNDFEVMNDKHHHVSTSPLMNLGIQMVSQFPYEYMHLVCLGVVKKLLCLWINGPLINNCRIGGNAIANISNDLKIFWNYLPLEFNRKCRSLYEMERWKATEFRQFLLYSGPVALRNKLPLDKYQNFLHLFVGIYCLASPYYSSSHNHYAHQILCMFIENFGHLYGQDMVVYNIHGLSHLAADVKKFGPLDTFSAFPFENFLGELKQKIKKPNYPLQQIICRLHEARGKNTCKKMLQDDDLPQRQHTDGPLPEKLRNFSQFKNIVYKGLFFSTNYGNNCIKIGQKVGLIRNILSKSSGSEIFLLFEPFDKATEFFTSPLNSSDLDIVKVSHLRNAYDIVSLQQVSCKYVMLPYKSKFVAIPIIHQFSS